MYQDKKESLRMYAGDLSGLYGMRDFTFNDGRAKGVRAIEMRNDKGLELTVLADRCLDLSYCSYKGINIGLVNKVGISAPAFYKEDGVRGFLKQFYGGLLTTCGITASGAPSTVDGRAYGLHSDIGNLPAENVNKYEQVIDNEVALCISGDVRETCVFDENLVLHRAIRMMTEQNSIQVEDVVENYGFKQQPVMNLYHINFGYPILDAGAKCYFSTSDVAPRDEDAKKHFDAYSLMEAPEIGRPEECFIHTGGKGNQFAMLHNEKLGLAAIVHYDADAMPFLCQWKSCMAGDYALGIEPSVAGFWGLKQEIEKGLVKYIQPGEKISFKFKIDILDNTEAIDSYRPKCKESA
jgi:hypothetical protein